MQLEQCEQLKKQAHEYERRAKSQYRAVGAEDTDSWYEVIHQHFHGVLLPEIKNHSGEIFIEYWPAWFVVDREQQLRQGIGTDILYNYEYGSHGTGYVCVTNRALYLSVFEQLTQQYPLYKPSITGFVIDVLSKQMNRLRPFQHDYGWSLSPTQIQTVSIASGRGETERIRLVTSAGTWEIFEHFTDQRKQMLAAIECLRAGAFADLKPKWHVTKRPKILSEAALQRQRSFISPSVSLIPATVDSTRAERGLQLLDLHWLAAEASKRGIAEVELDLAHAVATEPTHRELRALHYAYARVRHLLERCSNEMEILDTLHIRLDREPELASVYGRSIQQLNRPYFKSWHPLPDRPHPALIRSIGIEKLHSSNVYNTELCWTWSNESNKIFIGSNDGFIHVLDLCSVNVEASIEAFTRESEDRSLHAAIEKLRLSPDGKTLVAYTYTGRIRAWNTKDWSVRFNIDERAPIRYCDFSADGNLLACHCHQSNEVKIYESNSGQRVDHVSDRNPIWHVKWGTSGNWLLMAVQDEEEDRNCRVLGLDLDMREEMFAFPCYNPHGISLSPSSAYVLVSYAVTPEATHFWDVAAADWVGDTVEPGVYGWAFSHSGKFHAAQHGDGQVTIIDAETLKPLQTFTSHLSNVRSCQFSPDGQFLLTYGDNRCLKLWDMSKVGSSTEPPKYFILAGDNPQRARHCSLCSTINADNTLVVVNEAHNHDAAILDGLSGNISSRHRERVWVGTSITDIRLDQLQSVGVDRCAVDASGKRLLLVGYGGWAIFDPITLQPINSRTVDDSVYTSGSRSRSCTLSSDGRWVAITSKAGLVLFDVKTEEMQLLETEKECWSCTFDPQSRWLVFSSGERRLWGGGNDQLHMLDLATKQRRLFPNPVIDHLGSRSPSVASDVLGRVVDCEATSDGALLLAAHDTGYISVWDTKYLGLMRYWDAHQLGLSRKIACKPLPDNKHMVSVASDGFVKLWNIATGKFMSAIATEGSLEDCDVFVDGKRIVAVGEAGVYWLEICGL